MGLYLLIIISFFDQVIDVDWKKDKAFIDDIKLNNNNKSKIINLEEVSFIKEKSYFFKRLN